MVAQQALESKWFDSTQLNVTGSYTFCGYRFESCPDYNTISRYHNGNEAVQSAAAVQVRILLWIQNTVITNTWAGMSTKTQGYVGSDLTTNKVP